jgi:hypothetical protein
MVEASRKDLSEKMEKVDEKVEKVDEKMEKVDEKLVAGDSAHKATSLCSDLARLTCMRDKHHLALR